MSNQPAAPTFVLRDAAGNIYGPASIAVLQTWILQSRIDSSMLIARNGTTDFFPITQIPELQSTLDSVLNPPSAPSTYPAPLYGNDTGMAVASLICSIAGVFVCPYILCIVGIVLGHKARRLAREKPLHYGGAGIALAGVITGYCMLALSLIVSIVFLILFIISSTSR